MVDKSFFKLSRPYSLREIADLTDSELANCAEADRLFSDVAPLVDAGSDEITFLTKPKFVKLYQEVTPGACFITEKVAKILENSKNLLICRDPQLAFAILSAHLFPAEASNGVISTSAIVSTDAIVGTGTRIDAGVVIGAGAKIGSNCIVGSNAVIGEGVEIGDNSVIRPNVTLSHCHLGVGALIHPGVSIGQDGFGFFPTKQGHTKIPQLGRVIIGDHVEIGANTAIDRGAGGDTTIGDGTKIDNLVHIAHNCKFGKHCLIAGQVGFAGSVEVGDFVMFGGQVAVNDHVKIANGARVAGAANVYSDVPLGETVAGFRAKNIVEWQRDQIFLKRLKKKFET